MLQILSVFCVNVNLVKYTDGKTFISVESTRNKEKKEPKLNTKHLQTAGCILNAYPELPLLLLQFLSHLLWN